MSYSAYERPLTFFDILGSIFRYKWRVMLVTCLMLIVSGAAIFLFPKKYESEAKLFVRMGRGSASLDPATIGQTISIQESRESEINSIVDMLESRGLAERVVDQIGQERILKKYAWVEVTAEEWSDRAVDSLKTRIPALEGESGGEVALTADEIDQKKEYELAVIEVGKNLKIDSPKKSTTIQVAYRGRTPELARDVVQAVLENYQQMHIDAYRFGGTLDFFDEQFEEQETIVAETEDLLRKAKNENSIVTMQGKQASLQAQITDVKKMQLQSEADLFASIAKVRKLQAEMDELPTDLVSEKTQGIAENATDAMRDQLYQLEIKEKELAAKFASSHPELVKLREQLKRAREVLDEQPTEREQTVVAINPIRIDIENKMLLAQAEVSSLEAKLEGLQSLENELLHRLNQVNDIEVVAFEMQRKIDIARGNHLSYAKKLEESRINSALDKQALSNVSVVAQPTLRYKHASPKRSVLALLGAVFSMICGIGVAMLSDGAANAREARRIREAERTRYLRDLESEKEMPTKRLEFDNSKENTAREPVAIAATPHDATDDVENEAQEELISPKKAK